MRLGTVCKRSSDCEIGDFEFIELTAENHSLPTQLPIIWRCPADLPAENPIIQIQDAVLATWRTHLAAAQDIGAVLMVVQFRRPAAEIDKLALADQYAALLNPLTAEARNAKIQLVLRMSHDNREQLNVLREIVRRVNGLAIALDLAYAHHQVMKNLVKEYLWDSDLAPRIAHVYAGEIAPNDPNLRLPLGVTGKFDWGRVVSDLRERYNASVTLDIGAAHPEYLTVSRQKWLAWWG